ncbi:hypothetical protein ACP4J4_01285 [Aureimonas ureilytica]|uniref:hypothetical protein n=1 Tax=Aureimonas ureilytica TaxID=401562 RepID=UPI003CF73388
MTTVLIWNNNMVTLKHGYPGHASMQIGNDWSKGEDFVSWVPTGAASASQGPTNSGSFFKDLELEGYAPDHIIHMPVTMNDDVMRGEWTNFKNKNGGGGKYSMYRTNCSNVVARVLKSASKKGSPLHRHSVIWTPLQVKRLAFDMGGVEKSWNWLLGGASEKGLISDGDADMLKRLCKRDLRHGPNNIGACYANGQRIAPRIGMVSHAGGQNFSQKFSINMDKEFGEVLMADGGAVYSGTNRNLADRARRRG